MLISRRFRIEENEETGETGFRPLGIADADPIGPMGTAHDVLEHEPDDDGSLAAEFRALGAAQYVRAQWSGWDGRDPHEMVSGDMRELYHHFIVERFPLAEAPSSVDPWLFTDFLPYFRKLRSDHCIEENEERTECARWYGQRWNVVRWMQVGYEAAEKRYVDVSQYRLGEAFSEMEAAASRVLFEVEEYHWAEVSFGLDTDTGMVIVGRHWEEFDEEDEDEERY